MCELKLTVYPDGKSDQNCSLFLELRKNNEQKKSLQNFLQNLTFEMIKFVHFQSLIFLGLVYIHVFKVSI